MTAKKFEPRSLSKIQVQAWQKLVASRRHLKIAALDKEWQFQFVLEIEQKDAHILSQAVDVNIRLGDHIGTVRCALLPGGLWLSEILRGSTIETIHEPFRTAVTGVILQDFFQALSRSSRLPLQLQHHSSVVPQGIPLYWQILNDQNQVEIVGTLRAGESLVSEICTAATSWPSFPWKLPDSLQVSVEVLVDCLSVRKDSTCFELGDVFLLGEFEKWKQGSLLIRTTYKVNDGSLVPIKLPRAMLEDAVFLKRNLSSANFSSAQQTNRSLTVTRASQTDITQRPSSKNMSEVQHDDDEAPTEHSWSSPEATGGETRWIDSVEVILEFSLGRHTMSLGELRHLGQGHVFPIQSPANGLVNIMVQGRHIGKGELVQMGQTVGILVRELRDIPQSVEEKLQ